MPELVTVTKTITSTPSTHTGITSSGPQSASVSSRSEIHSLTSSVSSRSSQREPSEEVKQHMLVSTTKAILLVVCGLSLLLVAGAFIWTYYNLEQIDDSYHSVRHSDSVMRNINLFYRSIVDTETGQRGYVITQNPVFLDPYNQSKPLVSTVLTRLKNLTADNPTQQNYLSNLTILTDRRLSQLEFVIELVAAGQITQAANTISNPTGGKATVKEKIIDLTL